MNTYIHNIATVVPKQYYRQNFLRERMKEYVSDRDSARRIIHRIYSKSGIDKRHTVICDFNSNGDPKFFFQENGSMSTPSTGKRNELYTKKAKELFVTAAARTLDQHPRISKQDITHVITVSCTGFFAPEPGYEIINQLGLSPSTQRYHLGFMGCFAAFPAMKMAKSFCESVPDARVLVVCLELCTIHLQRSVTIDNLISASVFSDGAAGMIISAQKPETAPSYRLNQFHTSLVSQSESDMAWTIGDTGFEMVLSSYVPDIIESNLDEALQPLFENRSCRPPQIHHWAVHPGGRAILDKVQNSFQLQRNQLSSSRKILAEYGNMSSATILFVLADLLKKPAGESSESVLALAFGPGLTIESGLLTKITSH